jgi:hypothetical protein
MEWKGKENQKEGKGCKVSQSLRNMSIFSIPLGEMPTLRCSAACSRGTGDIEI